MDPRLILDDSDFRLYCGDAVEVLRTLPDESIHMACTSPPFYGLRDYGTGSWKGGSPECDHSAPPSGGRGSSTLANWTGTSDAQEQYAKKLDTTREYRDVCRKCGALRVDQQIGLEPSPDEWANRLVEVFREVHRVLRQDGTLWIEIGDSYASSWPCARRSVIGAGALENGKREARPSRLGGDLKDKDLIMAPALLALALRADGWYLRSDIIWHKPNAMPESASDRPTAAHSHIFLFARQRRYFYDNEAIREEAPWERWGDQTPGKYEDHGSKGSLVKYRSKRPGGWASYEGAHGTIHKDGREKGDFAELIARGRNKRSVWTMPTEGFPEAHFATWPQRLVEPMILAGTSERGVCPDCLAPHKRIVEKGSGEAAFVANVGGRSDHRGRPDGGQKEWNSYMMPKTLGWEPGCTHGTEPIPATVLDPFIGTGTTAEVARRLGRRCVGIELSRKYADMAIRRTQQLSLWG